MNFPEQKENPRWIAFQGNRRIAAGDSQYVAREAKKAIDEDAEAVLLIFDERSSRPVEVDFRGSVEDVTARFEIGSAPETKEESAEKRKPGRPKLGVVSREVTLLPRHWEWLSEEPGGASVALRKLVEEARRVNVGAARVRVAQESAYRFLSTMAGNFPDFEEALRSFYAGDEARFKSLTEAWPPDVRDHARTLAGTAFALARAEAKA